MFLRFNFFPLGLELFAPCRSGLYFSRCSQKVADGDFSQILFHSEGKEDFA